MNYLFDCAASTAEPLNEPMVSSPATVHTSAFRMRPYQSEAREAVFEKWEESPSTLIVHATGLGKTVTLADIVSRFTDKRVMVVAHRHELIEQLRDTIHGTTGRWVDVEQADNYAQSNGGAPVVCGSVQTLSRNRVERFQPDDFGLLVIDECHHSTAPTFQYIIDHFRRNESLKVLGVTATPDRADEAALGQIFDSVAHEYDVADAIRDGWLVPIRQESIYVDGLDLSSVKTTAGDLNGKQLAEIMEQIEKEGEHQHSLVHPIIKEADGRQTLVFASSVAHGELMADIFNRHKEGSARFVCGTTPPEERSDIFRDYKARKYQFMVNVGIVTEGVDLPGVEVVAIARPTKSRSLYAQMIGRSTRPVPGLVDRPDATTSERRREMIAGSDKPWATIIDFVGNAGRHKLITPADVLGGKYPDDVVARAAKITPTDGPPIDVLETLEEAQRQIEREREEAERRSNDWEKRRHAKAKATYCKRQVDPFGFFGVAVPPAKGWDQGKPVTPNMRALLTRNGIDPDSMDRTEAGKFCSEIIRRIKGKKPTLKMEALLRKFGYSKSECDGMSADDAHATIDAISKNGWRRPKQGNGP